MSVVSNASRYRSFYALSTGGIVVFTLTVGIELSGGDPPWLYLLALWGFWAGTTWLMIDVRTDGARGGYEPRATGPVPMRPPPKPGTVHVMPPPPKGIVPPEMGGLPAPCSSELEAYREIARNNPETPIGEVYELVERLKDAATVTLVQTEHKTNGAAPAMSPERRDALSAKDSPPGTDSGNQPGRIGSPE